jgi:hypothetical protein
MFSPPVIRLTVFATARLGRVIAVAPVQCFHGGARHDQGDFVAPGRSDLQEVWQ